ncbi:hypothetical protein P175DRAFT_0553445 [Aspergillus ochraceoroseus IBT 24754]|uniref:Uncharacterized protein n=1 Tax=Aspergillus ochraceoroseus IBT 24754 TaxID=1392256 RepID=A0A2T5M6K3_9EURO|nr:uncharacterized protein P175DRAFT_0553445 [Aspergillus ochraceoroseus IBT 24754]PTU24163.1 hypothetical protein P175DRAFT_0553445 [Aspergillus ochraceoroseus IBT 24754]
MRKLPEESEVVDKTADEPEINNSLVICGGGGGGGDDDDDDDDVFELPGNCTYIIQNQVKTQSDEAGSYLGTSQQEALSGHGAASHPVIRQEKDLLLEPGNRLIMQWLFVIRISAWELMLIPNGSGVRKSREYGWDGPFWSKSATSELGVTLKYSKNPVTELANNNDLLPLLGGSCNVIAQPLRLVIPRGIRIAVMDEKRGTGSGISRFGHLTDLRISII